MKDRITLGIVIGMLSSIPSLILNLISFKLGLSNYLSFQLSGGIYLHKHLTDALSGFIFGGITWEFFSAFLGIAIVYLLTYTGKESWWLKGILVSCGLMYVAVYGALFSLGVSKVVPWDIKTNYSVLIENLLFGVIASFLAVRWGRGLYDKPSEKLD